MTDRLDGCDLRFTRHEGEREVAATYEQIKSYRKWML